MHKSLDYCYEHNIINIDEQPKSIIASGEKRRVEDINLKVDETNSI